MEMVEVTLGEVSEHFQFSNFESAEGNEVTFISAATDGAVLNFRYVC